MLCSKSVIFLLAVDKRKRLKFAPLSGTTSESLLIGKTASNQSTVVFYKNGKVFYRSSAALKIAEQLPFPWPIMSIFFLIPAFIRDYIYNVIGRNRYKWFGKNETCFVRHPNFEDRFLE